MPQASWYSKDAIKRAKAKKAKPPITKAMKQVGLKPSPMIQGGTARAQANRAALAKLKELEK